MVKSEIILNEKSSTGKQKLNCDENKRNKLKPVHFNCKMQKIKQVNWLTRRGNDLFCYSPDTDQEPEFLDFQNPFFLSKIKLQFNKYYEGQGFYENYKDFMLKN